MLGSVIGDLHGSSYVGHQSVSRELAPLSATSTVTSATVSLMAVTDHLLHGQALPVSFAQWLSWYPREPYGQRLDAWARGEQDKPTTSWGNGALMQIAPVVLLAPSLEVALTAGRVVTRATHGSAMAEVAVARFAQLQWMALEGANRDELLARWKSFGGPLHPVAAYRNHQDVLRQRADETLEDVMSCLAESEDFNELLGTCLYHGGDTAAMTSVAGALGELLWDVPAEQIEMMRCCADARVLTMLEALYEKAADDTRN